MRQRNGNPVVTTHSHRPQPALDLFNVLKKTVVGQRRPGSRIAGASGIRLA